MKKIFLISTILIIIVALFGLYVVSKSSKPLTKSETVQGKNEIFIKNYEFLPKSLKVKVGTTVMWTNKDIAKHTITSDLASKQILNSDFFGQGQHFNYTFNEVGTFNYHCEPHPYMKGTIEVIQ